MLIPHDERVVGIVYWADVLRGKFIGKVRFLALMLIGEASRGTSKMGGHIVISGWKQEVALELLEERWHREVVGGEMTRLVTCVTSLRGLFLSFPYIKLRWLPNEEAKNL